MPTTTTGRCPIRRRYSRKRNALGEVFGKPWQDVALEWDAKPMTLNAIALAWTRVVSAQYPDIHYFVQEVSLIIRIAKSERMALAPEPAEVAA